MARRPLLDDEPVGTGLVIGPNAAKPLHLEIPIFVSDMSFGALSQEAKVALATGAELAGTGICSGEGGMLPEEQAANSRYFYELASGRFGWSLDKVKQVQAFHFKAGQGAKTGTGGHLPGNKVTAKIAEVRGLEPGQAAISPSTFPDLHTTADFRRVADQVREASGGIPIGFKLSAQHIEADIDFALEAGADYIILDGRGGATGAAPEIFKQNISVPTMAALARARRHLDSRGSTAGDVTLIITGGLRTESDFVKAHGAGRRRRRRLQCSAAGHRLPGHAGLPHQQLPGRHRHPAGTSTRYDWWHGHQPSASSNYFEATVELMQVLARACGHDHLSQFCPDDLDDLETGRRLSHRRRLWRRDAVVARCSHVVARHLCRSSRLYGKTANDMNVVVQSHRLENQQGEMTETMQNDLTFAIGLDELVPRGLQRLFASSSDENAHRDRQTPSPHDDLVGRA